MRYFNIYRVVLAGLLLVLAFAGIVPRHGVVADSGLFVAVSLLYLAVGIASSFAIRLGKPGFDTQVSFHVLVDIVAISLLMHASGGVTSGLGTLLVITVAGASILAQGRIAILFAAIAAVAVLTGQVVEWRANPVDTAHYTHAGLLGAAFFATALLAHISANRIRASEALAAERSVDLANLAALNEHIIRRMQSGILVVDAEQRVVLSNDSAGALLGIDTARSRGRLAEEHPVLYERYLCWRGDSARSSHSFHSETAQLEVTASFAALGPGGASGVLVFLEDESVMTQRAQQLKLASLGRLTASIAHEIRNPLGAISHAGQLLNESEALGSADRRLTQIIQANSRRMNGIIEDILQLSRRSPAVRQDVDLHQWLQGFAREQQHTGGSDESALAFSTEPRDLKVPFDPDQLHQVVTNLTENGRRHSGTAGRVELSGGINPESMRPYLDIVDEGQGIPPDAAEHIFEPFFTTSTTGTGLGLYVARELCEANQASLNLRPRERGCCFRITFADPRRRTVVRQLEV